jgi:hypothetical protein
VGTEVWRTADFPTKIPSSIARDLKVQEVGILY